MDHIQKSSWRKSKAKRLGKMSSKAWDRAEQIIRDVLKEKLSGLQTVQVVTLLTSGMKNDGVLALLHRLVKDFNAFGIREYAVHLGEALDENLLPTDYEHMRLVIWNADTSSVAEFCNLYTGVVDVLHDGLLHAAGHRNVPVTEAIDWIVQYAKSPISNYEGEGDPDLAFEFRPTTVRLEKDDLYKVPCYRWSFRRKYLDYHSSRKRLADFIMVHGNGISVKEAVINHPKWP
ncbi:MAG: hypothetical protein KL863_27885 [Rhizobium sp.]|nr:hypothetical protein [Rhizobium sp.]